MATPDRATSDRPGPVRPRRRGRPAKISRHEIVEAAIRRGLDDVSMQAIASDLDVTAPALYSHVAGRDEVVALAGAALRERLHTFTSSTDHWRPWLLEFARLVRRDLAPSASALMIDLRRPGTSAQVGLGERGLQLLIEAGLTPAQAGQAVWLVFRVAITAGPEQETTLAGFLDDTDEVLARPGPGARLPATEAVHRALAAGSHDTFDFDLALVLDGIDHHLTTKDVAP